MWHAIAAGITGGSSLISSFVNNAYARSESKRAWERDVKFWNMQNEYNTPANQMARLKEAGLNPNLIYGNITPGNSSSSVSAHPAQKSMDFNASGIIDNLLRWKKENEENKLLKEQNAQIQISNKLARALFPWQKRKAQAEAEYAEDIRRRYRSDNKWLGIYTDEDAPFDRVNFNLPSWGPVNLMYGINASKMTMERLAQEALLSKVKSNSKEIFDYSYEYGKKYWDDFFKKKGGVRR